MYAIIDIETTGGNAKTGKITEIAIYIHNGEKIVDEFTSLINPQVPIPPFISKLTGISNQMVEDAPLFADVAEEIFSKTANTIFVAHNVNFDYSFMREEYRKIGYDFYRKKLCTVQLSRKSFPGLQSYSLGKLTNELNITMESHHRAAVDAFATVRLFEMILERETHQGLFDAHYGIPDLSGIESPYITMDAIEKLPDEAGVFYFFDKEDRPLYAQKSAQIKETVINKLKPNASKSILKFRQEIFRLDYKVTGSSILAQLIEIEDLQVQRPLYNFGKGSAKMNFSINLRSGDGNNTAYVGKTFSVDENIALFSTAKEAHLALNLLEENFHLESELINGRKYPYKVLNCGNITINELRDFLNLKNRSFILTDEGRNAGERSLILIKKGEIMGYCFTDLSESVMDVNDLEENLIPLKNSLAMQMVVRQSIEKKNYENIIYLP